MRDRHPAANPLVQDTGTPPIPEAAAWLTRYDGRLGPALRLSQAAPGMPPPPAMLEQLADAARDPDTATYGAIAGDAETRAAYAHDLEALYGAACDPESIAITAGCNQAFVVALMAVAKAGDAVLLPEPWYFNHAMVAQMLGIEVRALRCHPENGFVPDVGEVEALVADGRVRAIVLVTPNNPTGAIYPPATIEAFAALARDTGSWLLLDETYRDFLDDMGARPHGLFQSPALASIVLQLYSFSKSYAVPGYRLGALRIGSRRMAMEIGKILDCLQICAPRIGQRALVWAIPNLAGWREDNRRTIRSRAKAFQSVIAQSPGWQVRSIGAYFAYVAHPFQSRSAVDVARQLAEKGGVLALPGTYFGSNAQAPYLRFAFGNAPEPQISGLTARLEALSPR